MLEDSGAYYPPNFSSLVLLAVCDRRAMPCYHFLASECLYLCKFYAFRVISLEKGDVRSAWASHAQPALRGGALSDVLKVS